MIPEGGSSNVDGSNGTHAKALYEMNAENLRIEKRIKEMDAARLLPISLTAY